MNSLLLPILIPFVTLIITLLATNRIWAAVFASFVGATIALIALNLTVEASLAALAGISLVFLRLYLSKKHRVLFIAFLIAVIVSSAGSMLKGISVMQEKKSISAELNHAAFWLGSRLAPANILYEQSRNVGAADKIEAERIILNAFDKYKKILKLDIDFRMFFDQWAITELYRDTLFVEQPSLDLMVFDYLEERYGNETANCWVLGTSLSGIWNMSIFGGKTISLKEAVGNCINTLEYLGGLASFLKVNSRVIKDFKVAKELLETDPRALNSYKERTENWITTIEMQLLTSHTKVSLKLAEDLIKKNPNLAVRLLERYLKKNPIDVEGYHLISKACAALILTETFSIDPLKPMKTVEKMKLSLEKFIMLTPHSSKKALAETTLEILEDVLRRDSTIEPETKSESNGPGVIWKDDFEDGILNGWRTKYTTNSSYWLAEEGRCIGKGVSILLTEQTSWRDYELEANVKIASFDHPHADCRVIVRHQATQEESRGYHFLLSNDDLIIGILVGVDDKTFFAVPFEFESNKWYKIRVQAEGNSITLYVNDESISSFEDSTYSFGGVGLGVAYAGAQFDDVIVKEIK